MKKTLFVVSTLTLLITSCSDGGESNDLGQARLIKEKVKEPIEEKLTELSLGKQTWSTRNLSVTHFKNGTEIPQAKTKEEWVKACTEKKPVWCYYDFKPEHGNMFGRIYNWYAITDSNGLAPAGWHIPNDKEFTELAEMYGGREMAGHALKCNHSWSGNDAGYGTNESGFNGLPGGFCNEDGDGWDIYLITNFWSTDAENDSTGRAASLYANELDDDSKITGPDKSFYIMKTPKTHGNYVRCVKDK